MKEGLWILYALAAAALFFFVFTFCTMAVGAP